MPSKVEKVLSNFCKLTQRKKEKEFADYAAQLEAAYVEAVHQQAEDRYIVTLPSTTGGLQKAGGRLLRDFIIAHPEIEALHLQSNMLNEVEDDEVTDSEGFDALLSGLAQTRAVSRLRVLDLSDAVYSPEQMQALAEQVISDHPSLVTLKLEAASITDEHLQAMASGLRQTCLKTLSLRQNQSTLKGKSPAFEDLVAAFIRECPDLQMVDLAGNNAIKAGGPAAQALLRLVTEKTTVFVRLPQDPAVESQSLRNHYTVVMPMQWSLVDDNVQQMQQLLVKSGISLETLQELPALIADVRANRDDLARVQAQRDEDQAAIAQRFDEMNAYVQGLSQRVEEMNHQFVQKIAEDIQYRLIQEEMLNRARETFSEQREWLHITPAHDPKAMAEEYSAFKQQMLAQIAELSERVGQVEGENSASRKAIKQLKESVTDQKEMLEILEEKTEEIQHEVDTLKEEISRLVDHLKEMDEQWKRKWEDVAPLVEDHHFESTLTTEQAHYVKQFKKNMVQMYMVASSAASGHFQLTKTGIAGAASTMLKIGANVVPWLGGVLSMFAYFLENVDAAVTESRMKRILNLGATPEEVARLSVQLSRLLLPCLAFEHQCKESTFKKLMSASHDIIAAFSSDGFYGALFAALEVSGAVDFATAYLITESSTSLMEERAQSDSHLLIAAISDSDVPKKDHHIDIHRLFLFAAPVLTLVDYVFMEIVKQFCANESCADKDFKIAVDKRRKFYTTLANSFHYHAEPVAGCLQTSTDRQQAFLHSLATGFSTYAYGNEATGVLFFSAKKKTFSSKYSTSIRDEALVPESSHAVVQGAVSHFTSI